MTTRARLRTGARIGSRRLPEPARGIRDVAPAWALALLVTLTAFVLARQLGAAARGGLLARPPFALYDANWYLTIARSGYRADPHSTLRFFPLYPLLERGLGRVLPGGAQAAGLLVANAAALGYAALVRQLALVDPPRSARGDRLTGALTGEFAGGHADVASAAAWLLLLAPLGFVLVTGYPESLAGLLAAGALLALRRDAWWAAAAAGLLAGLTRPLGVLVAVPAAVEVAVRLRAGRRVSWPGAAAAVVAPIAGTAAYLGWVGSVYGDPLLPYRLQTSGPRAALVGDPLAPLHHSLVALWHGTEPTVALNLPAVLISLALLVVCARRLPASYTAFAAVTVLAALTARTLDSYERYALSAFPLVIALASVARRRAALAGLVVLSTALGVFYATLAFQVLYTP